MCDRLSGHFVRDRKRKFLRNRKRLTPGSAGEEQLGVGGAALTLSMAAYRKVCSPFWIFPGLGFGFFAILLCLADARPLAAGKNSPPGASAASDSRTFF